jgi:hypothetical protein
MSSRIAHHIDFPDYDDDELTAIAQGMLAQQAYRLADSAEPVLRDYIGRRRRRPRFALARSIRNAIDRARLRHASRLLQSGGTPSRAQLETLEPEDFLKSSVFADGGADEAG